MNQANTTRSPNSVSAIEKFGTSWYVRNGNAYAQSNDLITELLKKKNKVLDDGLSNMRNNTEVVMLYKHFVR